MSDNDNIPQDQETEEELADTGATSSDPSDTGAEGDPPIIIQGSGSDVSG